MTVEEPNAELDSRWAAWLLRRNQRGMKGVLWIVLALYPSFGVLDYVVAPPHALWFLYGTRAAVTCITLALFRGVESGFFRRHPNAITASYMTLISLGISAMTVFMGGLASPYYAGLSLVIVGSGLLFVWPLRVVAATYSAIVLSFLAPNLLLNGAGSLFTNISNQFFLIST